MEILNHCRYRRNVDAKKVICDIQLLPAPPDAWKTAIIKASDSARKILEIEMFWKDGKLTKALITSKIGGNCKLRTKEAAVVKNSNAKLQAWSMHNLTFFLIRSRKTYGANNKINKTAPLASVKEFILN